MKNVLLDPAAALSRVDPEDKSVAAKSMEAYFLRRLLAEVRSSSESGLVDGGFAGGMFRDMLDDALAEAMAEAGGIGLAETLERQLDPAGVSLPPTQVSDVPRAAPAIARPSLRFTESGVLTAAPLARLERRSSFGPRKDPIDGHEAFHAGLDFRGEVGTPVQASGGGTIVHAGPAGTYGNLVVIDHGGGLETRYAHLDRIDVAKGQAITPGQTLGTVGATGRVTGPHLHFEVRRDGQPIDPEGEISGLKVSP